MVAITAQKKGTGNFQIKYGIETLGSVVEEGLKIQVFYFVIKLLFRHRIVGIDRVLGNPTCTPALQLPSNQS